MNGRPDGPWDWMAPMHTWPKSHDGILIRISDSWLEQLMGRTFHDRLEKAKVKEQKRIEDWVKEERKRRKTLIASGVQNCH